MSAHAVINADGVVDNIILIEGDVPFDPGEGLSLVDLDGLDPEPQIGWTYAKGKFKGPDAPEVPAPSNDPRDYPLKRWEFKAMVGVLGVADKITAAIDAMPDQMPREIARARYENSDVYERGDALFDQLAPAVGLSAKQIDKAWMQIVGARTT